MRAAIRLIIAFGVASTVLSGCSSAPPYDWVGTWRGSYDMDPKLFSNEVIAKTVNMVEVKIKPEDAFEMFEAGIPKSGTVKYIDGKAYLQVEEVLNQPIERQGDLAREFNSYIELKPIDADHVLYSDPNEQRRLPDGSRPAPVRLERQR